MKVVTTDLFKKNKKSLKETLISYEAGIELELSDARAKELIKKGYVTKYETEPKTTKKKTK